MNWRNLNNGCDLRSPQTLTEADRRLVAAWAADCAERALPFFEADCPDDARPRALIERARVYSRGGTNTADEIRRRFDGGVSPDTTKSPAAMAAARSAGQAAAVAHMGAHALGAAAYAAEAFGLADPATAEVVDDEVAWRLDHMTAAVRVALRSLPAVGQNSAGPLGPGLLSTGQRGEIIAAIQAGLTDDGAPAPDEEDVSPDT